MSDYYILKLALQGGSEGGLDPEGIYQLVMWWRRSVIAVSSTFLIVNIYTIIKFKQYHYNTLRMFLFLQVFTLIAQLSVLPHNQFFQGDRKYFTQPFQTVNTIIQSIIRDDPSKILPCSFQAYVNLFSYNVLFNVIIIKVSYLFALLITLYVRRVVRNQHKSFMRKHLRFIVYVVVGTMVVYLPPFVLSLFNGVPYSFGPVGFEIKDNIFSGEIRDYMFYCGIAQRSSGDFIGTFLAVFNMLLIPVILFIIHSVLLYHNRKSMKLLRGLDELNPRQWFILKSGTLSVFVFVFQCINFIKFALQLIDSDESILICVVGMLNMIFDFVPIVLVVVYYKKYYQQGKRLQANNLLRVSSMSDQSFISREIVQY